MPSLSFLSWPFPSGARDWSESDDEEGSSGDEDEGEEEFRPSDEEQVRKQ